MEEYDFFNNEEDIIKVFKGNQENEFELQALRNIIKKRLSETLSKSFARIIVIIVVIAVTMVLSIAKAYLLPIQQKTGLIKQQLNEQKMDNYLDTKK
jgi:hypothetical protein